MDGSHTMGPIDENTRWVHDPMGEPQQVQINPRLSGLSTAQKSLEEALEIIASMINWGSHEGRCTNIDHPEEICSRHVDAFTERCTRAAEFLSRFHIPAPQRELTDEEREAV